MNNLPRLMLVTQRARMKPDFSSALEAALYGGARLIQLREKDLPDDEMLALAHSAKTLCENYGATLIINSAPEIARALDIGLHLPEGATVPEQIKLCGASVHSLKSAQNIGKRLESCPEGAQRLARSWSYADETPALRYLVFGSVFQTQSHPDSLPAGPEKLREVCAGVKLPVFAIGGIDFHNAQACFAARAHGIAVIGAVWDAPDVELTVRHLKLAAEKP